MTVRDEIRQIRSGRIKKIPAGTSLDPQEHQALTRMSHETATSKSRLIALAVARLLADYSRERAEVAPYDRRETEQTSKLEVHA